MGSGFGAGKPQAASLAPAPPAPLLLSSGFAGRGWLQIPAGTSPQTQGPWELSVAPRLAASSRSLGILSLPAFPVLPPSPPPPCHAALSACSSGVTGTVTAALPAIRFCLIRFLLK